MVLGVKGIVCYKQGCHYNFRYHECNFKKQLTLEFSLRSLVSKNLIENWSTIPGRSSNVRKVTGTRETATH